MESLARLLDPPTKRPWYQAALDGPSEGPIEPVLVPVLAWALARAGNDRMFMSGAAHSIARLLRRDGTTSDAAPIGMWLITRT